MRVCLRGKEKRSMLRDERGSLVLEAAMTLPVSLAVLMLFLSFLRIGIADICLRSALSDSVEQVAVHLYPVRLAMRQASGAGSETVVRQLLERWESADGGAPVAGMAPGMLRTLADDLTASASAPAGSAMRAYVWKPFVLRYADQWGDRPILNPDELRIDRAVLPDWKEGNQDLFGLEASYRVRLAIPFLQRGIVLHDAAYERVWADL